MFQTGIGPEPAMRPSGSAATKPRRASSKSCRSEKGKLSRTPALASRVADSASLGCARAARLDAASVVTSTAGVIHLSTTGAAIVSSPPIFIFNIRPSRQGYGKLEGAIGRRDTLSQRIVAIIFQGPPGTNGGSVVMPAMGQCRRFEYAVTLSD